MSHYLTLPFGGRRRFVASDQLVYACPYWSELATFEKTVFALVPMSLIVPTTITRITASMTAYSAMSCPFSSFQSARSTCFTLCRPPLFALQPISLSDTGREHSWAHSHPLRGLSIALVKQFEGMSRIVRLSCLIIPRYPPWR